MKLSKRQVRVANSLAEWESQFMSYKALKRQMKLIHLQLTGKRGSGIANGDCSTGGINTAGSRRDDFDFTRLLDSELEKVNRFYVDKEEDYIIRLKELQIEVANLNSDEEKLKVQKDILDFHAEMVRLLQYSVLNFTGLVKIVKKHQRRVGCSRPGCPRAGSSICLHYTRVLQQPFCSTDLVFNLMRECQVMLNCLSVTNKP